ncbi:MAG: hypothetical protein AB1798_17110, partial [Spirochaetota bacterium]
MKKIIPFILLLSVNAPIVPQQTFSSTGATGVLNKVVREDPVFTQKRKELTEKLAAKFNIKQKEILTPFEKVPRHLFVPDYLQKTAYEDSYLPLGLGQTLPSGSLLVRI